MGLSGPSLFIMPNGQYKGKTLQQILDLGDTGYIHWVSKHWRSENIRRAAADIAVKAGITDASDNGNRQRRGRGEYQSYTTSERDALWARHKDRYLALVGQGLDPNRHCSDIAKALGLTREEGHILHTVYSAWVSMQESPVDLSFLERV